MPEYWAEMDCDENGGLCDGKNLTLKQFLEEEFETRVSNIIWRVVKPKESVDENLLGRVVKEEIQKILIERCRQDQEKGPHIYPQMPMLDDKLFSPFSCNDRKDMLEDLHEIYGNFETNIELKGKEKECPLPTQSIPLWDCNHDSSVKLKEKLLDGGTRNGFPKERSLRLKFLGEVPQTVCTGSDLKGIKDEFLKLALLDEEGNIVTCGPESSSKVEIVVLDENGNDDENSMTSDDFEGKIIRAGDKEKPHFAKSVYINLEKGGANLIDLKLGHDKDWSKLYNCRLGARIVQNLRGIIVQEAWTALFKVVDRRSTLYKKHYPPSLSSEVWRLEKIAKKGESCKRLIGRNIKTLRDFLFWLYVNPVGLREILHVGDSMWKTVVAHAQTCIINDNAMFSHESSTEPKIHVIYNAVGELKGVVAHDTHFVRIDNLSNDRKDHAHELLSSLLEPSAFVQRYRNVLDDVECYTIENQIPSQMHNVNVVTNTIAMESSMLSNREAWSHVEAGEQGSREFKDPEDCTEVSDLHYLCAGNVAVCRSIVESSTLLHLAVLLKKGEDEVKYYSAMALMEITAVAEQDLGLRQLAFDPTCPIAKAVVDQLLKIVEKSAECKLLIPSIRSIANLATTFLAMKTRFIPPLVNLLNGREPEVSCEATLALNKFACPDNFLHRTHRMAMIRSGGHKHLIPLIYLGEQMVQIPSFKLLCYLAMHVPDKETLENILITLKWSAGQPHLMQDEAIVTLVSKTTKWLEHVSFQDVN